VYTWPQELAVQAELKASKGDFQGADALYERATDVIEGMLVKVPGPASRSSLVGAMSEIHVKHFNLAVRQLKDVTKAFRILEQARGRSEADMLGVRSSEIRAEPTRRTAADAEIAKLQLRLRAAERPAERRMLLSRIFEVEQDLARTDDLILIRAAPVELRRLQGVLQPDEMVLEFVLEEPSSFCLAIMRTRVVPVSLAGRGRIENLVDRYLGKFGRRRWAMAWRGNCMQYFSKISQVGRRHRN